MRVPAGAMTSRRLLFTVAGAGLSLFLFEPGASSATKSGQPGGDARAGAATSLSQADERLLDEVEQAGFRYFWECADAQTGLVKDRSGADGPDAREAASIAATGFGLTALCIADQRRWKPRAELRERVHATLQYLADHLPHEHGFFYHFV